VIGLAFGGNHLNSLTLVQKAMLACSERLIETRSSSIHQTKALGEGSRDYFNAVLLAKGFEAGVEELWQFCQKLESDAGRLREEETPWGNRPLDIDILFFGQELRATEELILPHPQMHRRSFVLEPLKELDASWRHPVLNKGFEELVSDLGL
jgi:2-amino-4-hydroxy-6-hydroxymethyldihydropteridine diphosphokinase